MPPDKQLPKGAWVYARLAHEVTEEEFASFLADRGMRIPVENITLRQNRRGASGIVVVPRDVIVTLLNWVMNGEPFKGKVPQFELLNSDQRGG